MRFFATFMGSVSFDLLCECSAQDEDETPPCESIMSYILDNLPESGILCQDSAGFRIRKFR